MRPPRGLWSTLLIVSAATASHGGDTKRADLLVASQSDGTVQQLDGETLALIREFPAVPSPVGGMRWSLQYTALQCFLFEFQDSDIHRRWDMVTARRMGSANVPAFPANAAATLAAPGWIYCSTRNPRQLRRFSTTTGEWAAPVDLQLPTGILPASALESVTGSTILLSASDGLLYLADLETGACAPQFLAPLGITSIAWDDGAGVLYLGYIESNVELRTWPGDGALLGTIQGSAGWSLRVRHHRFLPRDSWPESETDADGNGVEDWWEEYLADAQIVFGEATPPVYGITMLEAFRQTRGLPTVPMDVDGDGAATPADSRSLYGWLVGSGTLPVREP